MDGILGMQSLGPGYREGWNGRQGRRRRLVLNRFQTVLILWNRMTFDFSRTMEGAVKVCVCSDGSCSREAMLVD